MKNAIILIVFTLLSVSFSFSQDIVFHKDSCDHEFVFDYRMIYNDYESSIDDLIETKIIDRYLIDITYIQGEFSDPNELFVGINTYDNPEYMIITRLCMFEKIFQTSDLHKELNDSFKRNSKNQD